MALDLGALVDWRDPAATEARLRAALDGACGDEALILRTQLARAVALRGDFEAARAALAQIAPQVADAGAEVRARHALEWGRTFASAKHAPAAVTDADRAEAREAWRRAAETARNAGLDALAIDALHMMAFVDTAPAAQLAHAEAALAIAQASTQADARRWQASLLNNRGVALHALGRFDEALAAFEAALAARRAQAAPAVIVREARWMVGWTLRALGRLDEALALQRALAHEADADGAPDPFVFEELEALHRARGETAQADAAAARRRALDAAPG